jgi:pantoate--beta-alanine ligase
MKVCSRIEDIRKYRLAHPSADWGLVPTMGYLHEGHLSLVKRAHQENDKVGVSIFVNPAQFNDNADLEHYPIDLDRDLELLQNVGADIVWVPVSGMVYPEGYQTIVDVKELTQSLEGASRPGHFTGMTTIVTKLFNIFQPLRAYFGQKDIQQALVVKRMTEDLNFNTNIILCPTVREANGLAMSSRNARLTEDEKVHASCIYGSLMIAKKLFDEGERDASVIRREIKDELRFVRVEYLSIGDPQTLKELVHIKKTALVSLAVFIREIRLIDNIYLGTES